jgi:osmotically-inducible protein OsmY
MKPKSVGAALLLILWASVAGADKTPASVVNGAQSGSPTARQIYDALNADPVYYFKHVDVQVTGGVVTLSGYVWSTQAIYRARDIAGRMPGVTRVVNQLELERNGLGPPHR